MIIESLLLMLLRRRHVAIAIAARVDSFVTFFQAFNSCILGLTLEGGERVARTSKAVAQVLMARVRVWYAAIALVGRSTNV